MNRVPIICHPLSGGGKGRKVWREVSDILTGFRLNFISYFTDESNSADLLVQQIIQRHHTPELKHLIVIGGDGTLHEVVTALTELQQRIPITFIAAGGGNDFDYVWSRDATPRQMIETMLYSRTVVDVPIMLAKNLYDQSKNAIINSMGFGFDANVNYNRYYLSANTPLTNIFSGRTLYRLALLMSLPEIPHFRASLQIDGKVYSFEDASMILVMNHAYMGSEILVDNTVDPKAEEIAVAVYHDINTKAVRDLLPRVFKHHNHDESPYITQLKGKELSIKLHDPIRGQVDGEPLVKLAHQFHYQLSSYPFYLPPSS